MELGVSPDTRRVWTRVLQPVAAGVAARAPELSAEVVARIRPELPDLFPDDDAIEANRASTEGSVRAFAALIESGGDLRVTELPPETLAYARDSARQRIPFGELMRSYRLAHAVVWEMLSAELAAQAGDRDELHEAIQICSSLMFAFVDAALVMADEAYSAERERWHRSAAAAQADTIDAIVTGRLTDGALAGRRLRYELDREHVGLVAWSDSGADGESSIAALEAAVAQLVAATGAEGALVQPSGLQTLTGWLSTRSSFDAARLEGLRLDPAEAPGVLVAIGEPAPGIDGFRRSHDEAGQARRLAMLGGRLAGSVTRYGKVALQALATVDVDQARAYVDRQLGGLASGDDTSLRLAATLRTYLDEHASRGRAAKRLGVHENTISYRIRQAEEILGRSVEEDTLDLRVALALVPVLR